VSTQRISIRAVAALAAATIAVIAAAAVLIPASAHASHAPESIFQDDDSLIYADATTVSNTLDTLASLGVQRLRLTIQWNDIAPDPSSTTEPADFDATDPNDYTLAQYGGSPDVWAPYDRIVEMAAAHGIGVDFNVTAPGPLWAMQPAPVTTQFGTRPANHYDPSATDFGQFVQALGTRYSGTYIPPTTTTTPAPPPTLTIPLLPPIQTTTTPTRRLLVDLERAGSARLARPAVGERRQSARARVTPALSRPRRCRDRSARRHRTHADQRHHPRRRDGARGGREPGRKGQAPALRQRHGVL